MMAADACGSVSACCKLYDTIAVTTLRLFLIRAWRLFRDQIANMFGRHFRRKRNIRAVGHPDHEGSRSQGTRLANVLRRRRVALERGADLIVGEVVWKLMALAFKFDDRFSTCSF
jgi:hypothetical protein